MQSDPLSQFHAGVPFADKAFHIPWHVSEDEFVARLPPTAYEWRQFGWVGVKFSLLGLERLYNANFATFPYFHELQYSTEGVVEAASEFSTFENTLLHQLGKPTMHIPNRAVRWHDSEIVLQLCLSNTDVAPHEAELSEDHPSGHRFDLSLLNSSLDPDHWNNSTLRQRGLDEGG